MTNLYYNMKKHAESVDEIVKDHGWMRFVGGSYERDGLTIYIRANFFIKDSDVSDYFEAEAGWYHEEWGYMHIYNTAEKHGDDGLPTLSSVMSEMLDAAIKEYVSSGWQSIKAHDLAMWLLDDEIFHI